MNEIESFGLKEWTEYVRGTLNEPNQSRLERLLQSGDERAFDHYMAALENAGDLPGLKNEEAFSERVMAAIPEDTSAAGAGRFGRRWREPIVLYTVAAAAALLLTFTGAFDRLGEQASRAADGAGKVSYSQMLADGASSWLGGLKAKGESKHESTSK
ncbi:hypothetical protein [Saccharibacillus alkalitolerans]|uniref:Anti sigma-E protein RseA N-terminal domain-containing protein n=1 Tax=Saccharibacillus alkalitolerans TaxID=2705290 RepID=A0ABX0F512_9BACL|nr:hypothetical protein [Saccharibacillus alkalitolerans]NGZ74291.1 hypothetical protein [Saccharibacillus alkalitolerans]